MNSNSFLFCVTLIMLSCVLPFANVFGATSRSCSVALNSNKSVQIEDSSVFDTIDTSNFKLHFTPGNTSFFERGRQRAFRAAKLEEVKKIFSVYTKYGFLPAGLSQAKINFVFEMPGDFVRLHLTTEGQFEPSYIDSSAAWSFFRSNARFLEVVTKGGETHTIDLSTEIKSLILLKSHQSSMFVVAHEFAHLTEKNPFMNKIYFEARADILAFMVSGGNGPVDSIQRDIFDLNQFSLPGILGEAQLVNGELSVSSYDLSQLISSSVIGLVELIPFDYQNSFLSGFIHYLDEKLGEEAISLNNLRPEQFVKLFFIMAETYLQNQIQNDPNLKVLEDDLLGFWFNITESMGVI